MAENTEKRNFTLTNLTLFRVDQVSNINSPARHTTMRVVVMDSGKLAAITEEQARQIEEEMREEMNPQAVKAHG